MNSLGWHDVFHSTSLRDPYGNRNANITYSGMETKIVYAVGCASMVFVGIYAIIICVVNSLGTTRRNSSVAPMNEGRHDMSPGRMDKDLSTIWQSFVVTEMHEGDAGGSRGDTLSKEHPKTHKDSLNDDRNDGTAKKQRLDRTCRSFPKAETVQADRDQAKESFRTSTVSEDDQGSSLVECQVTSPSTRSFHGSSSRERLMAPMEYLQTSSAGSLQAYTATSIQTATVTATSIQTSTAREGLQISTETSLETVTSFHAYTARSLQTFASGEGLQIYTARENIQPSAADEGLQTSTATEGFQITAAGEGLQTPTAPSLQTSTSNEGLHASTAEECFHTSPVRECLRAPTAIDDFQESTSMEVPLTPPTSEASKATDILHISPDSGFQLPSGGTDDPMKPLVAKYPRTSVSNSHLYSLSFTDTFHGQDQGSPPRLLNTLWTEKVFQFHRPSRVFTTSNSAPNLLSAQSWNELEHNVPLFHPKNSLSYTIHIV